MTRELPAEIPDSRTIGSENGSNAQTESLAGLSDFANIRSAMTNVSASNLPSLELSPGSTAPPYVPPRETEQAGKTNRHGGGSERDAYLDREYAGRTNRYGGDNERDAYFEREYAGRTNRHPGGTERDAYLDRQHS